MKIQINEKADSRIAIVENDGIVLQSTQDALDFMATLGYQYHCDKVVLHIVHISADFFDLKTGLAGEILQKYTNYGVKLAIVGDFSIFSSKSLHDFMRESNKGQQIFFLPDKASAVEKLHSV